MRFESNQKTIGIALGVLTLVLWLIWTFWSRAPLAAMAVAALPPALVLFRWPAIAMCALAFSLTSYLDAFVPHAYKASLYLALLATLSVKAFRGDFNWTFPPFVGWSLLFYIWIPVTILWSRDYSHVNYEPIKLIVPFMLLMPEFIRTPKEFRLLFVALGAGMVVTAVSSFYGVYSLFAHGLAVQAAGSVENLEVARYYGHWPEANHVAHTLMPFMVLFLPLIRRSQPLWLRIFFGISFTCGIIAIMLSLSRAGILGLAVALMIVIWNSRYRWRTACIMTAIVVVTAMILPIDFLGRINSLAGGKADASITQRTQVLHAGLEMVQDSFPFGFGMGSFFGRQQDYYTIPFKVPHAHNSYIQILSEYGIVGMIFFVLAILSLFQSLARKYPEDDRYSQRRQLRTAMFATIAALLIAMLFETMIAWPSYWLAFILVSTYPAIFRDSEPQIG